ncbi:ATP-binding cassette domain-containing protein [Pseudomonas putida]
MLSFLMESIKARKALFLSAAFMVIIMKACTIIPAFILGKIIDDLSVKTSADLEAIIPLIISFAVLIALQSIINPVQTYQLVKLVQSTIKDKSIHWTKKLLEREFEEFASLKVGGILRSLERGITAHEKLLTFLITTIIPLTIEIILVSSILIYVAGSWVLFAVLTSSALYLTTCHFLINWRRPHLAEVNNQEDIVSTKLVNTLQAGKQIKLEQAHETSIIPLCNAFSNYAKAAIKVAASGAALSSARILFIGVCTAGILAWGIHDQTSISPRLTVGELVAVFSITGGLLMSISGLAEAYRTLDQFIIDKQRLSAALALPSIENSEAAQAPPSFNRLSLRSQPGMGEGLISFNNQESVAIVGVSGSGKTTLLETLAGTIQNRRTDLFVDGTPLHEDFLWHYLHSIRYCPQSPQFLEGNFHHSVLFGRENTLDLHVPIKKMGLSEITKYRFITEGAKNISGGEAKRLSLLRLVNRPGRFNLFDEPTSFLDKETANRVWDLLFSTFHEKGLICVTHDVEALANFDRVIVINEGGVLAVGPWSELKNRTVLRETLEQMNAAP